MSTTVLSNPLFESPTAPTTLTRVNDEVCVEEADGLCVVWVHGAPWHRFATNNRADRRVVGANLVLAGLAKSAEVERGLGLNHDTLYRDRKRMEEGGIPAVATLKSGPKGPRKATPDLRARAKRERRAGLSKRAIARKLGVGQATVDRMLGEETSLPPAPVQQSLLPEGEPALEGEEATSVSEVPVQAKTAVPSDSQPANEGPGADQEAADEEAAAFMPATPHPQTSERDLDRTVERVWARFGLLDEAEVRYVSGSQLQFVGALLIVPALVATGFFRGLQEVYGGLKGGFYGLRHTVLTAALMFVLRLKRVEHLAGASPTALGRLLGLDRAPEVKTLRRRLREIARQGKADEFMRWFAKHLAEEDPDAVGFLYVDGHTRIYYGKREVSKAYSTRKRLALPAVTDFWVNDVSGQPFFVVTGEVSQSLTQQLMPLIEKLQQGEILPDGRRVTFVFDRGGWSPKLFKRIVEAGHDFLTYRKGKYRHYPQQDFVERTQEIEGREISYSLRDGVVRLNVGMEFRQIVRREENGHQIAVVTSRRDVNAVEAVYRLGERWRQENFFKYARDDFGLDALDTYEVEAEDADRTVPNPERKKLDKEIRDLRKRGAELEAELGQAADANEESHRPTIRGFKIAHGKLRQELAKVREDVDALVARRRTLPTRVPIGEATEDEPVRLEAENKHFMNTVKMAVYRAETSLLGMLAPYYRRNEEEGRALLREAFRSSGSLRVSDGELLVVLNPLSARRRTKAIAALCDQLNAAEVRIPGTTLRLRFEVSRETGVSELAMAPCQEV